MSTLASFSLTSITRTWAESLLCFILPVSTFWFLFTGPHTWDAALMWTLPVWLCIACDFFSPVDRSPPKPDGMEFLLDARLYVLFALQYANILLLLEVASSLAWGSLSDFAASAANIAAMRILVGTTSCCSGIAVAHELLHRRRKHLRWMGRIMLWTVCYDHFALEHAHGHHRMVGTATDPATARKGESFADFFKRSAWGQWANAWQTEGNRLLHYKGFGWLVHHRVLKGLAIEFVLLALIMWHYGSIALLMFLYQSLVALRMLEAVNYIQHWGLTRGNAQFKDACAWSTDSWFTLHSFIGLSRHSDHHALAGIPCYCLRYREEGPSLPHGYFVMSVVVRFCNDRFIQMANRELMEKNRAIR